MFSKYVKDNAGDEFEVIGEYINDGTKIEMRHKPKNGEAHLFRITPGSFKAGSRCGECAPNKKKTSEKFANEAKKLYGDEFELLSKYVNNSTPVRIKHNCPDCNYSETSVYPSDFLHNGVTCRQCAKNTAAKKRTISQIEFEKTVRFLTDDEYSVLSKYTKATEEVMFRHNCPDCNYHVFPKKAIKFTSCGERCPICSRKYSGGVRRINKILRERNITFSCEKTYNNLIGVHKLRYDFCIRLCHK